MSIHQTSNELKNDGARLVPATLQISGRRRISQRLPMETRHRSRLLGVGAQRARFAKSAVASSPACV